MKRALIYNPYFDTLGGGERYTAGVIATLEQQGYTITIAWPDKTIVKQLADRFNIPLQASVDPHAHTLIQTSTWLQKRSFESSFDCLFWVSDGSVPALFSRRNIVHFQVPFKHTLSLAERLKIHTIHQIVCNSQFTKQIIDHSYQTNSVVVYPPCGLMQPAAKQPMILGVGRFDGLLNSKRQDVLIQAFKQLRLSGWKLVLAGGSMGQSSALTALQQSVGEAAIEIIPNPSFTTLRQLYSHATLFWHAAGFGVNETMEPEKVEHFGIVTVEAMSAEAIPLVYDAGGQREIIHSGENGYLWHTIDELVKQTLTVINAPSSHQQLVQQAKETSQRFSMETFSHEFTHLCLS